ncbi:DUF6332 family protein [Streptomyces coeruleoprunus]|uniref:DUF6332 family protein n=1 Tax=Streptomyces coeruleoprunus TaxID=285563 RepID=A0ABV9XM74_9ACTN
MTRDRVRRDAVTVQTGYALGTAALLAAALFCLVGAPVPVFGLHGTARDVVLVAASAVAAVGFVVRVARALWRFAPPVAQPSQPGRTSPDS